MASMDRDDQQPRRAFAPIRVYLHSDSTDNHADRMTITTVFSVDGVMAGKDRDIESWARYVADAFTATVARQLADAIRTIHADRLAARAPAPDAAK